MRLASQGDIADRITLETLVVLSLKTTGISQQVGGDRFGSNGFDVGGALDTS